MASTFQARNKIIGVIYALYPAPEAAAHNKNITPPPPSAYVPLPRRRRLWRHSFPIPASNLAF